MNRNKRRSQIVTHGPQNSVFELIYLFEFLNFLLHRPMLLRIFVKCTEHRVLLAGPLAFCECDFVVFALEFRLLCVAVVFEATCETISPIMITGNSIIIIGVSINFIFVSYILTVLVSCGIVTC